MIRGAILAVFVIAVPAPTSAQERSFRVAAGVNAGVAANGAGGLILAARAGVEMFAFLVPEIQLQYVHWGVVDASAGGGELSDLAFLVGLRVTTGQHLRPWLDTHLGVLHETYKGSASTDDGAVGFEVGCGLEYVWDAGFGAGVHAAVDRFSRVAAWGDFGADFLL